MKLKAVPSTDVSVFEWEQIKQQGLQRILSNSQKAPVIKIQITPSRKIKINFLDSYVETHPDPLVLDEWTFVNASFFYAGQELFDYIEIFSNIIVGTNSLNFDSDELNFSDLPDAGPSALFRIGGSPSFIGEISNINFYNPGGVIPPRKDNFS